MMEDSLENTELPKGLMVFDSESYIEIVRVWFSKRFIYFTISLAFTCFLIIGILRDISPDRSPQQILGWLLFFCILLGPMAYYVLAGWLNRTHVFIGEDFIGVRHRPLPWFGSKDIRMSDVKQVYCKANPFGELYNDGDIVVWFSMHSSEDLYNHSGPPHYQVGAVTKSGQRIRIVSALETPDQAVFIARQVQRCLDTRRARLTDESGENGI